MSGRWWLTPRLRRAILSIHMQTAATPVAFIRTEELPLIVGSYAGNIIKALVSRELIAPLESDGVVCGYELTPLGHQHAERIARRVATIVDRSATRSKRVG